MSFSNSAKTELCSVKNKKKCCLTAELNALLLFGNVFSEQEIRIITKNQNLLSHTNKILKTLCNITPETLLGKKLQIIIKSKNDIIKLYEKFGYTYGKQTQLHINGQLIFDDCCRAAFLRGAILSGGFINDPEIKYHFEIVTPHKKIFAEFLALLNEMNILVKQTIRSQNYVAYTKDSEQIEDILTIAGANRSAITVMETKVIKDVRNRVNRNTNCEAANLSKTISASRVQINAIKKLKKSIGLENLPAPLKAAAELRLKYPNDSIQTLVDQSPEPTSKSGLNHRLQKLIELSQLK